MVDGEPKKHAEEITEVALPALKTTSLSVNEVVRASRGSLGFMNNE